jgi:hypothetical protein
MKMRVREMAIQRMMDAREGSLSATGTNNDSRIAEVRFLSSVSVPGDFQPQFISAFPKTSHKRPVARFFLFIHIENCLQNGGSNRRESPWHLKKF